METGTLILGSKTYKITLVEQIESKSDYNSLANHILALLVPSVRDEGVFMTGSEIYEYLMSSLTGESRNTLSKTSFVSFSMILIYLNFTKVNYRKPYSLIPLKGYFVKKLKP